MPAASGPISEAFFPALLGHLPSWFFLAVAVLLLLVIGAVCYVLVRQAVRFTAALNEHARVEELKAAGMALQAEVQRERSLRGQLMSGLRQLSALLEEVGTARPAIVSGASPVSVLAPTLRRLLESLSTAIKRDAGATHRCAVWLAYPETRLLVMLAGSSGFPPRYEGRRSLGFDSSIAGRAYVRGRVESVHPVQTDGDFESLPEDRAFESLVCVPLRWENTGLGVLTVDGSEPFSEQDALIATVYAKVAQMMIVEWSATGPEV